MSIQNKATRLATIRDTKANPVAVNPATDELAPPISLIQLLTILLGSAAGAISAVVLLPTWLPGLTASLLGSAPHAYWYLSRATAMVAYVLLWMSMGFGLLMTNKLARLWPGGPLAFELHQHTSLLGLAFAVFHGLILLGDRYTNYTLVQLLLPFASSNYRPLAVGLGQVTLYLLALIGFSFYLRDRIGRRGWRLLHYASFAGFGLALLHGLLAGSDSSVSLVSGGYWVSAAIIVFLSIYRVLQALGTRAARSAS